ncbi:TetR family transcriptional regulator [candidate division KSB1 bacterium]|nr:TetR family transcriptional regulator [candidate division KSB1 bacterium]
MEKPDKKQEILDAAMHCLARYGMLKSTMDDIARVMGLKKASLYYYYKNKEAIFTDAMEREAQRFHDVAFERTKTQSTAAEKLMTTIKLYYEYFRDRAEWLELNAQAMVDNHSLLQDIHKRNCKGNRDFLAHFIREGIDNNEFRTIDADHAARVLHLALESQHLETYRQAAENRENKLDYQKLEKDSLFILDIFINGLSNHKQDSK